MRGIGEPRVRAPDSAIGAQGTPEEARHKTQRYVKGRFGPRKLSLEPAEVRTSSGDNGLRRAWAEGRGHDPLSVGPVVGPRWDVPGSAGRVGRGGEREASLRRASERRDDRGPQRGREVCLWRKEWASLTFEYHGREVGRHSTPQILILSASFSQGAPGSAHAICVRRSQIN